MKLKNKGFALLVSEYDGLKKTLQDENDKLSKNNALTKGLNKFKIVKKHEEALFMKQTLAVTSHHVSSSTNLKAAHSIASHLP